ncbi:MAG: hypothetical protein ACLU3I_06640 [Acutalibacteraceae bacterium]
MVKGFHCFDHELSALLDQRESDHIGIGFADDRNIFYPKISRKKQPFDFGTDRYYVLQSEQGFFVKRSSRRVWDDTDRTGRVRKKFRTEAKAQKYLTANHAFFSVVK